MAMLPMLQALRMEEDESLELWYLLCCAALQADEGELAAAEAAAALEFAVDPPPRTARVLSILPHDS